MKIKSLISEMSLEEKAAQLSQIFEGDFNQAIEDETYAVKLGFDSDTIYSIGSFTGVKGKEHVHRYQKLVMEKSRHKIPAYFILDIVHGYKINFPIALATGCSFNPSLFKEAIINSAIEAKMDGVDATYSPMIDMTFDPRWGRTIENHGEDHYLGRVFSDEAIKGFQENNLASCAKHFVGYGFCEGGRDYGTASFNNLDLYNVLLEQFRGAIENNVKFIMAGFSAVDGVPPTANKYLLKTLLRSQMGYEGIIISDHSSIPELVNHGLAKDEKEAAFLAFDAGVDVELATTSYMRYLPELVREGRINMEDLDAAVLRVLKLKEELGLFTDPYYDIEDKEIAQKCRITAFDLVCESSVLLKNDNVLPINMNENYIAMGPNFDEKQIIGFNAACVNYDDTITMKQGMDNYKIKYQIGPNISHNEEYLGDLPKGEKILFFGGEHYRDSGEAMSRASIQINEGQVNVLRKLKQNGCEINLILFAGRALDLTNIDFVDSILLVFLPGTEGGNAVAAMLKGDVSPSGRLTTSLPRSVAQIPIRYNVLPTGREKTFDTQEWVNGYSDMSNEPLYAFGYGLTYGNIEYSNFKIDNNQVTLSVKNSGPYPAKEVVQLYYHDKLARVSRPKKQLFNFKKVELNPGEEKVITLEISPNQFDYYIATGELIQEDGEIEIFIAKNVNEVMYSQTINIKNREIEVI